MAEAGSAENGGKLRNRAGSILAISIAYAAIVSPAPGSPDGKCATFTPGRFDDGVLVSFPSCIVPTLHGSLRVVDVLFDLDGMLGISVQRRK